MICVQVSDDVELTTCQIFFNQRREEKVHWLLQSGSLLISLYNLQAKITFVTRGDLYNAI
jgi:hypothetical protein